jgi:glyoxylase-like metal-dependent hydrolase (beta-lactamase superfamily II)
VSEELDVALVGDLVMERDGELAPSPWLVSYDTDEVQASVDALAERAPDFEAACMGHGEPLAAGGSAALPVTEPATEEESSGMVARLKGGASRVGGVAGRVRGGASRVGSVAGRVKGAAGRIR